MKGIFLAVALLAFIGVKKLEAKSFKWQGIWECYSTLDNIQVIGTLTIKKLPGKKYGWNYRYKNDIHLSADPACSELICEGVAIAAGANILVADRWGIKFTCDAQTAMISVIHDYTDPELVAKPFCFGGDFVRKQKKQYLGF